MRTESSSTKLQLSGEYSVSPICCHELTYRIYQNHENAKGLCSSLVNLIILANRLGFQTLAHQALIQETVSMISPQFVPKVSHIKQAIDHLIDKEYLERAEGSRDT